MSFCKPENWDELTPTERALSVARHELTTLNGLIAADGAAPQETFNIDTSEAVALIDEVLATPGGSYSPPS